MAAVALMARRWLRHSLALTVMRVIGVIGVVLVLASSTPFPIWVYCVWLILWLATFLITAVRTKNIVTSSFLALSLLLCLLELPYHLNPKIPVSQSQHVYVLGDSISAGMGTSERNWPSVLGDISHLQVTNLSQPGATTSSALSQEKGITMRHSLIIIEIGGNDMLGTTPGNQFFKDLDTLLNGIPSSSRCIMFELPLLPFHNGYGQAQRILAREHNVLLIPKSCLTNVIGKTDDTLDGLHLSQKGHDALARSVFSLLTVTR